MLTDLDVLAAYDFRGRNETAIREEWIAPLLRLLGYGLGTLNRIEYEERLELRKPVRKLGRSRYQVDYRPTVLGRSLWIIEAKAVDLDDDWDEHLAQAWSYATHPEVDVPLMAIADGRRFAAYDVTAAEWDAPVVDFAQQELSTRFDELRTVLGGREVADFVRRRQLRHLGTVMRAQLNPLRLDEIVADVGHLAKEAREDVVANRAAVLRDEAKRRELLRAKALGSTGTWGLAQETNQPFAKSLQVVDEFVEAVLKVNIPGREAEFQRMWEAIPAADPADEAHELIRGRRAFWFFRVVALSAALKLRGEAGCGDAANHAAKQAARDHLLGFPDDPVSRASHRWELVLVPFLLRGTIAGFGDRLSETARLAASQLDDEALLRLRPDADTEVLRVTTLLARRSFAVAEWTAEALDEVANDFERLLPSMPIKRDGPKGQAADPFLESWETRDPLLHGTLVVVAAGADNILAEAEIQRRLCELTRSSDVHIADMATQLHSPP